MAMFLFERIRADDVALVVLVQLGLTVLESPDDIFNGFGDNGIPPDECSNPPVANRSFEYNKFIFDERETPEVGRVILAEASGDALAQFQRAHEERCRSYAAGLRDVYRLAARWPDDPFWSARAGPA